MLELQNTNAVPPERVVILGAGGFVGGATHERLKKGNIPVLALTRRDINLLEDSAVQQLTDLLKPTDSLVVISAVAPVKNNAMLEENIAMMSVVCAAVDNTPPAHCIYVSSDAVYADSMEALTENSCAQPATLHGAMHLTREVMLENAYSGPLAVVRPTLIYGAKDPHNGYGPNRFMRLALAGEDIVLFGEGEERRDHVLVNDVAEIIHRILVWKCEGILNIATGAVTSFRDIAELVNTHFDSPTAIKGTPRQGDMPHNGYRSFNIAESHVAFPDFKYTTLTDGLSKMHQDIID